MAELTRIADPRRSSRRFRKRSNCADDLGPEAASQRAPDKPRNNKAMDDIRRVVVNMRQGRGSAACERSAEQRKRFAPTLQIFSPSVALEYRA